jgi:hypothetical protein
MGCSRLQARWWRVARRWSTGIGQADPLDLAAAAWRQLRQRLVAAD